MNSIGEGRVGGVSGGFDFLGPPLQNFIGAFSFEITIIYFESSAQAQSMGTLFE